MPFTAWSPDHARPGLGPAPFDPPTPAAKPVQLRRFDDIEQQRKAIYESARSAFQNLRPIQNASYRIEVADVDYDTPDFEPSISDEKKALLQSGSLHRPLKGTVRLVDQNTGDVVGEERTTLAHVPHLNSRGMVIRKGVVWVPRNQARLRPGVYTRHKKSGGIEAQFNVKGGRAFRIELEPESGLFKMNIGQSTTRLYPILRAMGITDDAMREAWGDELFKKNYRRESGSDDKDLRKVVKKLGPSGVTVEDDQLVDVLKESVQKSKVDPDVMEITMGERAENVAPEHLFQVTNKILNVSRGTADGDNRDSQAFQSIHSAEDFIRERLEKDQVGALRKLLWRATREKKLPKVQSGLMNKNISSIFEGSGLAVAAEDINPFEIHDLRQGIIRLGEGGISSERAVSREARGVQASYAGLIDSGRGPESGRLGLDLRVTDAAQKGDDNQLYTEVRNLKTGETETVSARTLSSKIVTFPGELSSDTKRIPAIKGDKIVYVPKDEVDYEIASPNDMMSRATAMIPFPESIKGQRLLMGARMTSQALPLEEAEAPYVQTASKDGTSLHKQMGPVVGARVSPVGGVVTKISPDFIELAADDGKKRRIDLYNNYPTARKTMIHNEPTVKKGQRIKEGDLVAKSNFTSDDGTAAVGRNLRTAFAIAEGNTIEDAFVISESAAKKLTSQHLYKHDVDLKDLESTDKKRYVSIYADKWGPEQLDRLDDDGVIREGATVNAGDPVVLGFAKKKKRGVGALMRSPRDAFADKTQTWNHHSPGVVTDVVKGRKGIKVTLKSKEAMKPGDKLCYSPDHEILTQRGWIPVSKTLHSDLIASLNPDTDEIEYVRPVEIHSFDHDDVMYEVESTQVSMCVTPDHKVYASKKKDKKDLDYHLFEARELFGRTYRLKNSGRWAGESPSHIVFPECQVKHGGIGNSYRTIPEKAISIQAYFVLLGLFLSEGNVFKHVKSGSYGIDITQCKESNIIKIKHVLDSHGIKYSRNKTKFRLYGRQLLNYFEQFGKCHEKYIPNWVFSCSSEDLKILFEWMMLGDGHYSATCASYVTTSKNLADDFQRLCLHIGYAGKVKATNREPCILKFPGREDVTIPKTRYDVSVYRGKLNPTINHSHTRHQRGQSERWVNYTGKVHCVTLERNHILYTRRNGKAHWSGNTSRYGAKGVISEIRPDEQMPTDDDSRPVEVIANSLGVISRTNPSMLAEAILGKISEKTGKPYVIKGFGNSGDVVEYALREGVKHGVVSVDDEGNITDVGVLTDPRDNRKIKNMFTGIPYLMKLHHVAEAKISSRDTGGYTAEGIPARGGKEGSKRIGLLDAHSLLSAGATEFLKDAKLIRGQRNDEYWRALKAGDTPLQPTVSFANEMFKSQLRAAGVNLREKGTRTGLAPLLDQDVDKIAQHEIERPGTFDFETMRPIKGGLFDLTATGGAEGTRFSKITLPRKIPHPLFVEPIQRVLGLTGKQFENVLSGKEELHGETGPDAVEKALKSLDVDREIGLAKEEIRTGKKTRRDKAVKKLNYLTGIKQMEINPEDLMISKIPVIPPRFRPISKAKNIDIVHDLNYLYHDLLEAKKNYNDAQEVFGEADDEYMTMMNAVKSVAGLREPVNPKSVDQGVKGILRYAIGIGDSPKSATFQRKVIGSAVDTVGRGVITADSNLDMDEVGVPEDMAWNIFKPFTMRRLRRYGYSARDSLKAVKDRTPVARKALEEEMAERPVVYNRAPSLHRYSYVGAWGKIRDDDAIGMPYHTLKGLGGDYDGDTVNIHVPVSSDSVDEVKEKLMPSKNLYFTGTFETHLEPNQDYLAGLFLASMPDPKEEVKTFANEEEARKAYARGEISARTPIRILA